LSCLSIQNCIPTVLALSIHYPNPAEFSDSTYFCDEKSSIPKKGLPRGKKTIEDFVSRGSTKRILYLLEIPKSQKIKINSKL